MSVFAIWVFPSKSGFSSGREILPNSETGMYPGDERPALGPWEGTFLRRTSLRRGFPHSQGGEEPLCAEVSLSNMGGEEPLCAEGSFSSLYMPSLYPLVGGYASHVPGWVCLPCTGGVCLPCTGVGMCLPVSLGGYVPPCVPRWVSRAIPWWVSFPVYTLGR